MIAQQLNDLNVQAYEHDPKADNTFLSCFPR
jgi:hypothetical protein